MPYHLFLKIGDLVGESRDERHPESIDIDSFSWGLSNTGVSARGGAGAGKAVFQDFSFVSKISKASPQLFLACATGQHFPKVELFVRRSGDDGRNQDYYNIRLADCLVSSYNQRGDATSEDVVPVDQFTLNFAKIELEYRAEKDDGSPDSPVKAGYDIKANKKV